LFHKVQRKRGVCIVRTDSWKEDRHRQDEAKQIPEPETGMHYKS